MPRKNTYSLLNNSRFYILAGSLLLSVLVFAVLRIQIPSDQLFYIRVQQVYGLLCLIYWYIALAISPVGYLVGKRRMKHIEYARRAIGVSAFYFALLHAVIALWGQLGGLGQLQHLPALFQWSLLGGGAALLVLAIMAATSFDRVIKYMTYRKWKWLHRLVYAALILVIIHVWSIGTHLAYPTMQMTAFGALATLSGLEIYRATKQASDKHLHLKKAEFVTFFVAVWVCTMAAILALPVLVQNYHSRHAGHSSASTQELRP